MLNDLDASLLGVLAGLGALLCLLTCLEPGSTRGAVDLMSGSIR